MPTVEELQAQLDDLNKKYTDEVENAKKQRQRAQQAESRLGEVEESLKEFQDRIAAQEAEAERKLLEGKGQYEEAMASLRSEKDKALQSKDAEIEALSSSLYRELGTNRLTAALGEAGVKSELIAQATKLLSGQIKVSVKDGKPVVQVLDEDGSPLNAENGAAATMQDLVGRWAQSNPHFLPPSGDTGSGAHKGGKTGNVTLAELDANASAKAKFIKEHGVDAYLKLAEEAKQKAAETAKE